MTEETTNGDVVQNGDFVTVGGHHLWRLDAGEIGGLGYVGPFPSNIADPMPGYADSNAAIDEAARDSIEAPMPDTTQAKGLGPEFAARISRFRCAIEDMTKAEMEIGTLRKRQEKFRLDYEGELLGIGRYVRNLLESEPSR